MQYTEAQEQAERRLMEHGYSLAGSFESDGAVAMRKPVRRSRGGHSGVRVGPFYTGSSSSSVRMPGVVYVYQDGSSTKEQEDQGAVLAILLCLAGACAIVFWPVTLATIAVGLVWLAVRGVRRASARSTSPDQVQR